jgi:uncharacterized protein
MTLTRYSVLVPDFPAQGQHLLYSTLSRALVVLESELKGVLDRLPEVPESRAARARLRKLERMGFLVADRERDIASLERYFRELKAEPTSVEATVLTTYACNFACTYCVEEGVKAAVHMDQATSEAASRYIVERARERRARSVYVSLYGGEPLLNMQAVRTVLGTTRRLAQGLRMEFAAAITTNGALLTPEVVHELVSLGVRGAKITIDGDRERHDAKRPFKDGRGSYDLIMRNIEYAVGELGINAEGNFDDQNAASFPALLDELRQRGLADKLNLVRFKPISAVPADRRHLRAQAELECVYSRPETAATSVSLRSAAASRGFPTDTGIGVNLCGMTLGGAHFTIDPTGVLYRCPAFVGHPEFSAGSIADGRCAAATTPELWRRCTDCAYAPLCGDGCMYGAYMRYGDPMRLNCPKDYVEYTVRENLKAQYGEAARTDRSLLRRDAGRPARRTAR